MCINDRRQNDQNNQATAAALRARSKKSRLDLVRENEERFRFCPSEKNMDKLLDDLSPFTYNAIEKNGRNSGKSIHHSPDYILMKPFHGGVSFVMKDTFIMPGSRITKRAKPFISYPLLPKSTEK